MSETDAGPVAEITQAEAMADGDTSTIGPGVGESTSAPSGPSSALGSINHLEPIEKHAATESRAEDVGAQVLGSKE